MGEAPSSIVAEARAEELDRLSCRIRVLRSHEKEALAAKDYRMAAQAVESRLEVEAEYDAAYRRLVGFLGQRPQGGAS